MLASSPAVAGADDHGHPQPGASVATPLAPRGEGRAEGIEAVAVAAPDRQLMVYLDREATNEPVTGAVVEVDADGWPLKLRETDKGVYVASDWVASPGPNRLTITYRLPEGAGKIEIQVDAPQARLVAPPQAAASRFEEANVTVIALAAAALYLLVMALFVWRTRGTLRRRQPSAVPASLRAVPAETDPRRMAAD
jgi:cobalt-zinc-cadmium efflux system membrane fusion protein